MHGPEWPLPMPKTAPKMHAIRWRDNCKSLTLTVVREAYRYYQILPLLLFPVLNYCWEKIINFHWQRE